MKSNFKPYITSESAGRIDDILTTSDASFEDVDSIPASSKLTYTNGFYVNCTCVFIDIRDSSGLTEKYKRPVLARIYRSFISESVAILNSSQNCEEVNIHGDAVWGVFNTPKKADVQSAFSTSAQLCSLVDLLNCRLRKKRGMDPISAGIGIAYGRALMIKAGYSGSSINEIVWMGDVVNAAAKLSSYGSKSYGDCRLMVHSDVHFNLTDENKNLITWNSGRGCYHGNIHNVVMNNWIDENCK